MKDQEKRITRAFETACEMKHEPADGTTHGWVSVCSDAPIRSMVRSSSLRAVGYERTCEATPDDPSPRQPAHVILSHAPGAILGDWVKDGIVLRDNHGGDTVARLMPACVRNGKLGGDQILWGTSERAQVIKRDVESGVRRNLSVEGDWDDKDLELEGEKDGIPVIRAARWTPLAAAIVDVPADPLVGVARSNDTSTRTEETKIENKPSPAVPVVAPVTRSKNIMTEQEQKEHDIQRSKENVEIFAMAREYNVPQEQVTEHIIKNKSLAEFQGIVLRDFAAKKAAADAARVAAPVEKSKVSGLSGSVSPDKLAQFSLLRAVRGYARRLDSSIETVAGEDDGLEREICQETLRLIRAQPAGKNYSPSGLPIPWDLVMSNSKGTFAREFNIQGTASNIIKQDLHPEMLIDFLRAKLVLNELGITTLTGLVGDVLIPKQTGTATQGAVAESTATTESDPTFGQIKVSPKHIGSNTIISRQTMMQSTPSADMLVMNDLINGLARKIQTFGFHGTGANSQPVGLFTALSAGYQGYAAITEATVSGDGTPTYTELQAMMGTPEEADVDGTFKWCMRPKAHRYLKGVGRVGTTGFVPIATGSPYTDAKVDDAACSCTTSLTSKYAAYGRWDSMLLAMWGAADLIVNPYTYANRGAVEITVLQSVDFGYRYLPAFGWSSKFAAS